MAWNLAGMISRICKSIHTYSFGTNMNEWIGRFEVSRMDLRCPNANKLASVFAVGIDLQAFPLLLMQLSDFGSRKV